MTKIFSEAVEFEAEVRHKVLPTVFVDKLKPSDATPSVQNVTAFRAGGVLVTITNFSKGQEGQVIRILGDGLTTIQNNATIINLGGVSQLLQAGVVYSFILLSNIWYQIGAGGGGNIGEIVLSVDGGGAAIPAGGIRYAEFPNLTGTIIGAAIISDNAAGSCVIDVWAVASPTIPAVGNSIVAAAPPTLAAQQRATVNVTTWSKIIPATPIFGFKVNSNTTNTKDYIGNFIREGIMAEIAISESFIVASQPVNSGTYFDVAPTYVGVAGNRWDTTIKRYSRFFAVANSANGTVMVNQMEPRGFIDAIHALPGFKYRVRECLAVYYSPALSLASTTTRQALTFWGFAPTNNSMLTRTQRTQITFRLLVLSVTIIPTPANVNLNTWWQVIIINDNLTTLYAVTTTVSSLLPHEFQILLDGITGTAYFYIDGTLWGQYTFASNTAPGQVTPYPAPSASAATRWNLAYRILTNGSISGTAMTGTFAFSMGCLTPLISLEFPE